MAVKNPADVAAKWASRASAAQPDYVSGIRAVTESPTAKAAKAIPKYQAGVQAAISSGKMARNLNRVTLADWQQATIEKGASRYSQGVTQAAPKMQAFLQDFLPFQETVRQQVAAMPSLSLQDNIARMVAMVQGTSKYVRK